MDSQCEACGGREVSYVYEESQWGNWKAIASPETKMQIAIEAYLGSETAGDWVASRYHVCSTWIIQARTPGYRRVVPESYGVRSNLYREDVSTFSSCRATWEDGKIE